MDFDLSCPLPLRHDTVQMAHGGGGRMMRDLLEAVMIPAFRNEALESRHDSAVMTVEGCRLAFTTDTYVVSPRFFPGGDIGKLAVYGTVNDLAMAGARPLFLSAAMVLEEGYPIEELRRVVLSMRRAAGACGVVIVTGDTKVVDKGKGDGLYINTAGVGTVPEGLTVGPAQVRPGDAVLVSGDVGRHGIAVLSVREGLAFETSVESDCGPLHHLVAALLEAGVAPRCLRDATRGGLASVLNEIAEDGKVGVHAEEAAIPVACGVEGACELLGLDPLYVACEGRMVAVVPEEDAERALGILRGCPGGEGAVRIGTVTAEGPGTVVLRTRLGTRRILDLLSGEQLPRIC
jgi:hydrogenase expression/formation protein HypE